MTSSGPAAAWFVYVVRCADRTLYTGITTDAGRRVMDHNQGQGARYTRSRLPVELVHVEAAADKRAAMRREREIKQMRPAAKRRLVSAGGGVVHERGPERSRAE